LNAHFVHLSLVQT